MLQPDIDTLARILVTCLQNLAEEGQLSPGDHAFEEVFGFGPEEIEGLHTHKLGVGDGLWFRLKGGRVVSASAEESDPDPALYDTVAN